MSGNAEQGGSRMSWRMLAWAGFIGFVLLIPLVAMQFTSEVAWDGADFVFAAVVLGGAAAMYEFTAAKSVSLAYRLAVALAVGTGFVTVWSTGAVGIIGSENNPANMMFGGVLSIALVGVIVSQFRPIGMAWAMAVTALAQAAVGVIAVIGNMGAEDPNWPIDVIGATGVFCGAWALSAALFRNAATR